MTWTKVALLPGCADDSLAFSIPALAREAKEFLVGVAFLVGHGHDSVLPVEHSSTRRTPSRTPHGSR